MPGVSTSTIRLSNLTPLLTEQYRVTDVHEIFVLNTFAPRIEFPVALFPHPDFPSSTILTSLGGKDK